MQPVCPHVEIVDQMQLHAMKLQDPIDCPDTLTAPLSDYTVKVLVSFIKLRGDKPPKQGSKKEVYIKYVVDHFPEYIDFGDVIVDREV